MAYNRFKELLAARERHEGRRIQYAEIKERYGIAESTLSSWATNKVSGYSGDVIDALCDFLDCEVGDLIKSETWGEDRPLESGQEEQIEAVVA